MGGAQAASGGAIQQSTTLSSGGVSPADGGQSSTAPQLGGASQGGSESHTTPKLRKISQTEANQLRNRACNTNSIQTSTSDLQVDWVIDASGSVTDVAVGSDKSKWELERRLVQDTHAQLAARGKCVPGCTGLLAFPLRNTNNLSHQPHESIDSCIDLSRRVEPMCFEDWGGVDLSSIEQLLGNIVPFGGTPLLDAYRYVVQQHIRLGSTDSNTIVLVTDGMPSIDDYCRSPEAVGNPEFWSTSDDDDRLVAPADAIIQEISNARSRGINTIVVGSSSEPAILAWLSQAANAGGTSWIRCGSLVNEPYCHLDLSSRVDLAATIANALLPSQTSNPCRFAIPANGMPVDVANIVPVIRSPNPARVWAVDFDGGPAEDCSDGFRLVSSGEIELCPISCNLLSTECLATIEVNELCGSDR